MGKIADMINVGKIDSQELITMKTLKVGTVFGFLNLNDFIRVLWFVLIVAVLVGYWGHRETDRRWSTIDGTWN